MLQEVSRDLRALDNTHYSTVPPDCGSSGLPLVKRGGGKSFNYSIARRPSFLRLRVACPFHSDILPRCFIMSLLGFLLKSQITLGNNVPNLSLGFLMRRRVRRTVFSLKTSLSSRLFLLIIL